jgi:hypothetical protein
MTFGTMAAVGARPAVATFSPADIANLALWLDSNDASTFTYSSGSVVSQWNDKSGNARHLSQATVANQPARSGTINGLPSVVFDGTADKLATADPGSATSQPQTLFIVMKPSSLSGSRNILGTASASGVPTVYTTGTSLGLFCGSVVTGGTVATGTSYVMQWTANGASSAGRINGGASALSGNPGSTGWRGYCLGQYRPGDSGSEYAGDIAEVIVYDSSLSLTDINRVGAYLAAKWGISWSTAT